MKDYSTIKSGGSEVQKERKKFNQHFIVSAFLPMAILFPTTWKEAHTCFTATVLNFKDDLSQDLEEYYASTFIILLYSLFRRVEDLRPLENLSDYLSTLVVSAS